jgi:hypothetical protein
VPSTTSSKGCVQARTRALGDPALSTGVAKRAAGVQVEHVRKLRKLEQKLYGTDIDSDSAPGHLLRCFRALVVTR